LRKTQEELQLGHPAIFPIALASRLIESLVPPGRDIVLDPFAGVGTTVVASQRLGKIGIGIELSPIFARIAAERAGLASFAQASLFHDQLRSRIICDDARNVLKHVNPGSVDLVITSPPYWDVLSRPRTADYKEIEDYGDENRDLGKISKYDDFVLALGEIFRSVLVALKPRSYCAVVVMDLRKKDRFYPLHSDLARELGRVGFELDDIVIWDRRHEYNNMRPLGYPAVFRINKAHEYVLILRAPQEISDQGTPQITNSRVRPMQGSAKKGRR
jgi:DNA modification methylase